MRLRGKVAIVTGAGAGLGQAVAKRFALEGARVVVAEIGAVGGEATVQDIQRSGGDSIFVQTDVSREQDVKEMVETATRQYGGVDVLYHNAAILHNKEEARAHELCAEVWDHTLSVNLRGAWICSKYSIPPMLTRGGGSIIHVASCTGILGFRKLTAYSASKGGVLGLMRAMAADYASDNIRVNALVPGTMNTAMNARELSDPQTRAHLIAGIPLGRVGDPQDITGLAVFLASDESSFCTGGTYFADGGRSATV